MPSLSPIVAARVTGPLYACLDCVGHIDQTATEHDPAWQVETLYAKWPSEEFLLMVQEEKEDGSHFLGHSVKPCDCCGWDKPGPRRHVAAVSTDVRVVGFSISVEIPNGDDEEEEGE